MKNELLHSVRDPALKRYSRRVAMILIADDNVDVRRMIRKVIEDVDRVVVECSDGDSAIEAYEESSPDFVLMDINMHPVDGLTAMQKILALHPTARIIVVSQYQDKRTRDTAIEMGAFGFVGKSNLMDLPGLLLEGVHRKGSAVD